MFPLRTQLFALVGSLILISSVSTLAVSFIVARNNVDKTGRQITKEITEINSKKREDLEGYFAEGFVEYQSRPMALLSEILANPELAPALLPEKASPRSGALRIATLLTMNKWLDICEIKMGGKELVMEVTSNDLLPLKEVEPIGPFALFELTVGQKKKLVVGIPFEEPPIGVPSERRALEEMAIGDLGSRGALILYDPQKLLMLSEKGQAPLPLPRPLLPCEAATFQKALDDFAVDFERAKKEVEKESARFSVMPADSVQRIASLDEGSLLEKNIFHEEERFWKFHLAWKLALILSSFDLSPESAEVPFGLARFDEGRGWRALPTDEIFSSKPLERLAFGTRKKEGPAVALFQERDRKLYMGAFLEQGDDSLSVGIEVGKTLSLLAISLQEHVAIFTGTDLIALYDPNGMLATRESFPNFDLAQIPKSASGFVESEGTAYYYIRVDVGGVKDPYLFIYSPKAKTFAFVENLKKSGNDLIEAIQEKMALLVICLFVLVLIILHFIVRRLTRPLDEISHRMKMMGRGEFVKEGAKELVPGPFVSTEIAHLYDATAKLQLELSEKEKIRSVLNKVVSPEIAEEILHRNLELGGELRSVTILFADIRGFTKMAQKMHPTQVVALLNECMTRLCRVIERHQGVIDKFMGDAVMALFGAPLSMRESIRAAASAALEMQAAIKEWNIERMAQNLPPIELGIAINHGPVVAGNMGALDRLNYTVIGAEVNLTSRLCAASEAGQILIPEEVAHREEIASHFRLSAAVSKELRGIEGSVIICNIESIL